MLYLLNGRLNHYLVGYELWRKTPGRGREKLDSWKRITCKRSGAPNLLSAWHERPERQREEGRETYRFSCMYFFTLLESPTPLFYCQAAAWPILDLRAVNVVRPRPDSYFINICSRVTTAVCYFQKVLCISLPFNLIFVNCNSAECNVS